MAKAILMAYQSWKFRTRSQFDPIAVEAFLAVEQEFKKIALQNNAIPSE
jgi:hypothetical protein